MEVGRKTKQLKRPRTRATEDEKTPWITFCSHDGTEDELSLCLRKYRGIEKYKDTFDLDDTETETSVGGEIMKKRSRLPSAAKGKSRLHERQVSGTFQATGGTVRAPSQARSKMFPETAPAASRSLSSVAPSPAR